MVEKALFHGGDNLKLRRAVKVAVQNARITDVHTHLFPASFKDIALSGIDNLLTYHYLQAEYLRVTREKPMGFFALPKEAQADRIWRALFVERAPLSEATRGVVTCLSALGLKPASDLRVYRDFHRSYTPTKYIDMVLKIAGVESVVMTNDPFDEKEVPFWADGTNHDPRFKPALRVDALFDKRAKAAEVMKTFGFDDKIQGISEYLERWADRMKPVYLAASLPYSFAYPDETDVPEMRRTMIIDEVLLPLARRRNIPFAVMIGVERGTNPELGSAGDSLRKADINAVIEICRRHPDNKFLVTMLSRENQHELAVMARKFPNLMPFGCWWFLNNPSIIDEITRERMELLGTSFIPQHSDARILDQVAYKWSHSRELIGEALCTQYENLLGRWPVTMAGIEAEVQRLFSGNFAEFLKWKPV